MARRGGSSTQRQGLQPIPDGNSNGLPPTSTIPAQIVHNAANANAQSNTANKPPFVDQVKEFLRKPELEDPDPICNAFIVTITNGGIDPFFKEDPFALGHLLDQGRYCIEALKVIFQQKPQLLLAARHSDDDEDNPQPPIILWLFPKLLGLLAQESLLDIHEDVQNFLGSCLYVFSSSIGDLRKKRSILHLYRSCVESILSALDFNEEMLEPSSAFFTVTLPSSSSISEFWPDSQQFVALPQGLQRTLSCPVHTILVGFRLLGAIQRSCFDSMQPSRASTSEQLLPWVFDSFLTLWHDLKKWVISAERTKICDEIEDMYMRLLEELSLPILEVEDGFSYTPKSALSLNTALLELTQSCLTRPLLEWQQKRLAALWIRLRSVLEGTSERTHAANRTQRNPTHLIADSVERRVADLCNDTTSFAALHRDLKLALCLWIPPGDWPAEVVEIRSALCSEDSQLFSTEGLNHLSLSVLRAHRQTDLTDGERPKKRRKNMPDSERHDTIHMNEVKADLYRVLPESLEQSLSNLQSTVQARYADRVTDINERQQCDLLYAFGRLACAGSRCLRKSVVNGEELGCTLCDAKDPPQRDPALCWDYQPGTTEEWKEVIAAMTVIIQEEKFLNSSKPRILMAVSIGRVYNHISDADYLNLEICSLGEWLLKSMTRSLRELRIAASQSLMAFLRDDINKLVRDKNRRATIQFFAEITRRNVPSQQETLIMAYGQAARVCGELEFHIILGQLVEYLGHPHTVISSTAFNELLSLADHFKMHPQDLLRPYWRTIGYSVVNEIQNKPQKADYVCELTKLSRDQLLLLIHGDILPVLVLNKRKDIVQMIAAARQTPVEDCFLQPRHNLANILALLLSQPGQDVERRAMDTLHAVAPGFRGDGNELYHLIQMEPVFVACEVLKLAADRDELDKKTFRDGFHRIASLDDMREGQRKSATKKKPRTLLELFFRKHILGVMAHFSSVLENLSGAHPLSERKRCVGAIREMIALAGGDSSYALPQLRACLQSAMADVHLCDQAFDVWSALLAVLEKKELKLVIVQTFALIVQNWSVFSDETRLKAVKTLDILRQNHNGELQEQIGYIPSLASIPMLAKLEGEIARLKAKLDPIVLFGIFSERCRDENGVVVRQALKELVPFLEHNQKLLHQSAISQKPLPVLITLTRSLLDLCVRYTEKGTDIPILCATCLGLIGGLDPYRVETVREKKRILVLSNFQVAAEVINFAAFMLEEILIKVFLSTTNANSQGYLAFLMQELCKFCGFSNEVVASTPKPRSSQLTPSIQRWIDMPEWVQNTLSPFLNSRYALYGKENVPVTEYPIFSLEISHATWLRKFTHDLSYKAKEENARLIFTRVARVLRYQDLSVASFILPFAVLSVILDGEQQDFNNISRELLTVLETDLQEADHIEATNIKQCSENIFQILDYLVLWLQEKRKAISETRATAGKTGRGISEMEELESIRKMSAVESLLQLIPARVISRRAVECGSYARALFHWEKYYREEEEKAKLGGTHFGKDDLLQHLQIIYAQIDEPDGIEGISAHLQVLNPEQQIMEHRKAGRWTAAQSWYELALAERPNDADTQIDLLTCLKESGQYDSILNYVDGFHASDSVSSSSLPFAAEAAWSTGKWEQLEKILTFPSERAMNPDFNLGIGKALLALRHKQGQDFMEIIENLRATIARGLSPTATASLHASHDHLVKLHTLYELEAISGMASYPSPDREVVLDNLDRRLDILGAYTSDKQYLLGVRRAAMELSNIGFTHLDIASAWLTNARLARIGDFTPAAFNSILHASQLGDDASKIEYSKMLWKEGHHRKAIQHLRGAIMSTSFQSRESVPMEVSVSMSTTTTEGLQNPNRVKAHAQLLLAKWLDRAGQTQRSVLVEEYARGITTFPKWDKGHYYLGRYYLKLYDSERTQPVAKQSANFIAGELTKLIIENYTRSTVYGTKHYYQTIPKILTLWLDLGMEVINTQPRLPKDKELYQHKLNYLDHINKYIKRYASERMPAYPWYTAFPQIITRISHPNKSVWDVLQYIILKVAGQYPQQALWSLLAVLHSTQDDRRGRGVAIMQKLRDHSKRKHGTMDLKGLIVHGQRLTDALLAACDAPVEPRVSHISLSRSLGFNLKLAPCALVVPIEMTMIPTLPSTNDSKMIRAHNPFPQDAVTIADFEDDVLVLASLQRPRRIVVRGSDGRSYGLLCKPKDDLRKDQRLMEFNTMINRALQRDIEASKRRLYIRTYGVTPLNEECGTIEWVEGLKPMRDILLSLYRQKGVSIDYGQIRDLLKVACDDPDRTIVIFEQQVLGKFKAVLHEWFVETFSEPEAWFAARLRYTRSCAVMSIVGHVLGLGDRHGENVLLEEGNGGTFHVDFNCLFDKGLTFEKPELVPFRLTHNMVDAMGPLGIEGAFRKTAELTYSLLRQNEDTLITILETFVHDPTADFLGNRKKKRIVGVPETPQEVLEMVRGKLGGYVRGESVPLSVEGYVDSLLRQARDPRNLAAMYIGWCAFF